MANKKESLEDFILKYCLQNAVLHNGKANANAVLGKIMSEKPELRKDVLSIKKKIEHVVNSRVNSMNIDEQRKMLQEMDPTLLEKKSKKEDLPELEGAVPGKVVTRFAPAPSGPLTIFHLMRAAFLSYLYAKKYKGKFVLRLEDSDPKKVKKEFYDYIKEDLEAVGIKYDKLVIESNNMQKYYEYAKRLIKNGNAYVCFCPSEVFREYKKQKKDCPCRKNSVERNMKEWKDMIDGKYNEGDAVLRLKTSVKEKNPVLRDPPLFRICKEPHPLQGRKYNVWPLYNYACALEDHFIGITHVFRAKEHEHNTAVQKKIYEVFGWEEPVFINFGMVYFPGEKLHTRDIKEGIKKGIYSGWDDVRLPTVRAFLRRGFHPKTFEEMAKKCGLSKTDIHLDWENLYGINRKIIDPIANRYMVVVNPVKITIGNLDKKEIKLQLHPDFPERGERTIPIDFKEIYVSKDDFEKFKNKKIRIIGIGNVVLNEECEFLGDELKHDIQKIQFVSKPNIKVEILKPDGVLHGLGEPSMKNLKVGDIIQMNRIGFGRIDKKEKNKIVVAFAHK